MANRRKATVQIRWARGYWVKSKAEAQKVARTERQKGYYARITKKASGGYEVKRSAKLRSYYGG